jgi:hypothetical protein
MYTRALENGISTVLESVLAYYLLKESMTNKYQWSGLGFVISEKFPRDNNES